MVKNIPALSISLCVFLFLSACATTEDDEARSISYTKLLSKNQINILKVSPGLTRQQVIETMGLSQAWIKNTSVTNPFKIDYFSVDKDQYEVLYYLTRRYPAYTAIKVSQATSVIIKNGKVVGLGDDALRKARSGGL